MTPMCLLQMIMSLLMDKGDTILCESYTYPHMIESLVLPRGFKVQGVATDEEGIIPEALSKALEAYTVQGGKPPRLLYTVPVGQNPTGAANALFYIRACCPLGQPGGVGCPTHCSPLHKATATSAQSSRYFVFSVKA